MSIGPVQLLAVAFDRPDFQGKILAELERLREHDVVRVIDVLVVAKDADGNATVLRESDLTTEQAEEFGAVVGALIGFGAAGEEGAEAGALAGAEALADGHALDDDLIDVLGEIPNDSAAAIALLEHRWAIPLRNEILAAGGIPLIDTWVHPRDLIEVGLEAAIEAEIGAA